jgi:glycine oxidase
VWIFDLDNTLHDARVHIFPSMHLQIQDFLKKQFGLDDEGASRMRHDFWLRYGTTLRGLIPDGVLRRFVHNQQAYLVPRRGLGLVVGATMVMAGFDRSDDPAAIERLAQSARRLIPALADAPVVEQWTGLRPRLNHGLPIISRLRPGLIVATGHFRNGILLAPITAAAVHALAVQHSAPCDLAPFTCTQLSSS